MGIESGWQLPAPGAGSPHASPSIPSVPSCPLCPCCRRSPSSSSSIPGCQPLAPRFLRLHLLQDHLPPLSFLPNPLENPAWREFPRARPFVTAVPAGSGGPAATTPLRRPAGAGDGAVPAVPVAPSPPRGFAGVSIASPSCCHLTLRCRRCPCCSGCWSLSQHLAGTNVTRTASPERPLCLWQWP